MKFARYSVPTKEEIRKTLNNKPKSQGISKVKFEEAALDGINSDIVSSQETILREEQRIKKAKMSLRRWLDVIYEGSSKKARTIGTRCNRDQLDYSLRELRNKFLR